MNDDELRDAYRAGLTIEEIAAIYRVGTDRAREAVKGLDPPDRDRNLKSLD